MEEENNTQPQVEKTETENLDTDFEFPEDDDSFEADEITEEVEEEQEEVVEENKTETTEEAEPESKDDFLELLYNDESKKITKEEAKALAQKGMNYDKIKEKLEALQNSAEISYLDSKAKEYGMTRSEYIQAVKENEAKAEEEKAKAEMDEMISNGVPESVAKEVMETKRLRLELEKQKQLQKEKDAQFLEKEKSDNERKEFIERFPNVKADEIPKEVFARAKEVGLISAYTEHELAETKKELESLRQNKENASKAPITRTTNHGTETPSIEDDFSLGFDSAF